MAGIGEATAIIAIAQVGIQLSKTIFEFASEVRDAPKEIRRVGRDICTTSERLEEIGRLIEKNPTSHLFSEGGIASAIRCSNECEEIITEVSILLAKGGWVSEPVTLAKKDLDISLLEALKWPFIRSKLASPQAELEKVKASLTLLFNSAMANASSNPMQSHYALRIPRLKQWADQATRRAEDTKRRARSTATSSGRPLQREVYWEDEQIGEGEEDAEMRQKFVEYQVKLIKEEEERRAQERAAKIQADKVEKQKKEEAIRQAIERDAIDRYKKQQEAIQASRLKREKDFREELARLDVEPEKIVSIIATPGFQEVDWTTAIENRPHTEHGRTSIGEEDTIQNQNGATSVAVPRAVDSMRPWLPRRFSKLQRSDSLPSISNTGNGRHLEEARDPDTTQCLELWLIDLVSGQKMELAPSHEWLRSKLEKARYDEVSHKLAKLKHPWRTAIQDFVHSRNEKGASHSPWKLCFIGLPRRVAKIAVFGHRRGDCLVRLILCQQRNASHVGITSNDSGRSGHQPLDDSSSTYPVPKADESVHATGRRGVLRHSEVVENRPRESEPREVSFADPVASDMQVEDVGRIKTESEMIDGAMQRGTTWVPSNLVPSSVLEELNLPWVSLSGEVDEDPLGILKIPKALTIHEIEDLKRVIRSKIIHGEIPWRKPPDWEVEQQITEYNLPEPGPDRTTEPKVPAVATPSAREGSRNDSNELPISAARSGVPNVEAVSRQSRLGIAGKDDQSWTSREHSGKKEGITVPQDHMNRMVGSEQQKDMEVPDRDKEYYRPRTAAIDYYDRPGATAHSSVPRSIRPPLPRRRPTYDDLPPNSSDWAYLPEEAYEEFVVRDGSRERSRTERGPSVRDKSDLRETYRPQYGDMRDDRIIYREREQDTPRYREERELVLNPREERNDLRYEYERPRREHKKKKPRYEEEKDDRIIYRERESVRPRDRDERGAGVVKGERARKGSKDREGEEIIVRRNTSPERPRFRGERDDGVIVRREEPREEDRHDAEVVIIRERERERERPSYKMDEEIVIRRDHPRDGFRYREEDTDEIQTRHHYVQDEVGALVLRSNRGGLLPSPEPWDGEPFSKAQRPMGEYNDSRADSSFRQLNTPAPSGPLASQSQANDNSVETDSDGIHVRPIPKGDRRIYTQSSGLTNEDIISSALKRFTTFNAGAEDRFSPTGMDSPDPASSNAPPYAQNMIQAQRRLDELLEKHKKATTEGDFLAASDLQFYAIPDVRALVEELKAQEARAKPLENFDEAEMNDTHPTTDVVEVEHKESHDHDLQPRITEAGSDGEGGDAVSKRRWSGEEVNSGAPSTDGTIEIVERREKFTLEPKPRSKERSDGLSNGNINGGLRRVVRRPTTATVEDDVGDIKDDKYY